MVIFGGVLLVGDEVVEGAGLVVFGGLGVDPDGFESGNRSDTTAPGESMGGTA
ncbi:hypothetical protein [Parafrankia sp. BMG5.11]|uniref:hypothetical protein n=1 Tax=Parafrankia sp. BMG5.11 TaxID=222540 RepID=UPI001404392A|nr:hypothetical protein [Parafrankia sp. BMG5.11]